MMYKFDTDRDFWKVELVIEGGKLYGKDDGSSIELPYGPLE